MNGRADPTQHLAPSELAALLGLEVPDESADADKGDSEPAQRFRIKLTAHQPATTVDAVHTLLADWQARGGFVSWGSGDQVSAFPNVYGVDGQHYWPWAIKPVTGTVEVVFQHLATRPPVDDTAVRDESRERINSIPGLDLPASRLTLRPSFTLDLIAESEGLAAAPEARLVPRPGTVSRAVARSAQEILRRSARRCPLLSDPSGTSDAWDGQS